MSLGLRKMTLNFSNAFASLSQRAELFPSAECGSNRMLFFPVARQCAASWLRAWTSSKMNLVPRAKKSGFPTPSGTLPHFLKLPEKLELNAS